MLRTILPCALALGLAVPLRAATEPPAGPQPPDRAAVAEFIAQAQNWLLAQQQPDGAFLNVDKKYDLGTTLLVIDALISGEPGLEPTDEPIAKALAYVDQYVHRDPQGEDYGAVHAGAVANYCTSLALMVWSRTGTADQETIEAAQNFLIGLQNKDENSPFYGGIGYGSRGEGYEDLSNTGMAVEALRESGLPADHPSMKAALQFMEHCQNLSEVNDLPWAGTDGGAVYQPDESKAGGSWATEQERQQAQAEVARTGRMRSYGSMTYQLIKSYLYLDLAPDDKRVQAALDWVRDHYQFEVNPGMPPGQEKQGLYYYLVNMSKTFDILGMETVATLPEGFVRDWRADLFNALREDAHVIALDPDGATGAFWINDAQRWGEGIPQLTTAYALKALTRIHDSLP